MAKNCKKVIRMFHLGRKYYEASGSIMGCIYTERRVRSDWEQVKLALEAGETVVIRPANEKELTWANSELIALRFQTQGWKK